MLRRFLLLPSLAPFRLPTTAVSPNARLLQRLREVVAPDAVLAGRDRLLVYESDALTAYRWTPGAVILPRTTEEVARVVRILFDEGVPIVPRGAGTGLSGGALAREDSVVVATPRMDLVLELDATHRRARVQPGVVNADLTRAAAPLGLCYAPDPSSQSACTLGGNVAENSGGPHCLKYGVTSRYVTGLVVVLPDGEVVELGRGSRESSGLDLVGLFVGSEGCFGIATEIEVGLVPVTPGVRTLLAIFREVEEAGAAVTRIMARGLLPAALEIIDGETIRAVESSIFAAGYPVDAGAALVVEFDGMEAGLDADVEEARAACLAAGAREVRMASADEERAALWRGRKKAFGAMGRIAPDLMVQDATVPRSQLAKVLRSIAEIGKAHGLTVANVFHAGDGNLHPNLLFDRRDPDQLRRVEEASSAIMDVCVEAGGTITGEHGVGVDKRRYMSKVLSREVLEAMAGVKEAFDPGFRCNPGKVLPDGILPFRYAGTSSPSAAPVVVRLRELGLLPTPLERLPSSLQAALGTLASGSSTDVLPVVAPASAQAAADVLGEASRQGWRVGFVGAGTSGLPSGADLLVHSGALGGSVEHQAEDLTLTLPVGRTLAEVEAVLRGSGQWLPLGLPRGGTVGGALARGWGAGLEPLYGAPRELALGVTLITGDGRVLELGGRVLKNVAGFDLVKAVVGSRGVLGMLAEAHLRLFPTPQLDGGLSISLPRQEEVWPLLRALREVPVPLAALEAVGSSAGRWRILVRAQGREEEVEEILSRIEGALNGLPSQRVAGEATGGLWEEALGWEGSTQLLLRMKAYPEGSQGLVDRAFLLERALGPLQVAIHGFSGVVRVSPTRGLPAFPPAAVLDLMGRLRREVQAEGGSVMAVRRPAAWAFPREMGGDGGTAAPGVLRLEESIRKVFDPAGILLTRERSP